MTLNIRNMTSPSSTLSWLLQTLCQDMVDSKADLEALIPLKQTPIISLLPDLWHTPMQTPLYVHRIRVDRFAYRLLASCNPHAVRDLEFKEQDIMALPPSRVPEQREELGRVFTGKPSHPSSFA